MRDDSRPGTHNGCIFGLLMAGMAGGCAVGPNFSPPAAPSETTYSAQPVRMRVAAGAGTDQQRVDMGGRLRMDWWTLLGSQDLDQAVQLALSNNKTLDIAEAKVAKATEEVKAARGALYPQVDASAQFGQQSMVRRSWGQKLQPFRPSPAMPPVWASPMTWMCSAATAAGSSSPGPIPICSVRR